MILSEIQRSTVTCRYYKPDPIPDDVMARVIDAGRWAPNGGNRQPVRFVIVRDPVKKRKLADWYLAPWKAYLAGIHTGDVRVGALDSAIVNADYFAEHLHEVPAIVVVCAELAGLHPTDNELGRLSIVGGASVYPAVQNVLLAAREEGLGTALTTLLCYSEVEVKALLGIPDSVATACHVAIGYPERPFPAKLGRRPLAEVAFADEWGAVLPGA